MCIIIHVLVPMKRAFVSMAEVEAILECFPEALCRFEDLVHHLAEVDRNTIFHNTPLLEHVGFGSSYEAAVVPPRFGGDIYYKAICMPTFYECRIVFNCFQRKKLE